MSFPSLNRRRFLGAVALSGAALELGHRGAALAWPAQTAGGSDVSFGAEAARLTAANMAQFWNENSQMFRAPVLSAETVPSDATHDRGYTLWASLLGLHSLVEGEKTLPGCYAAQIAAVYDGLEQYYNPQLGAYTAWVRFPGNADAYYDDNSWAVTILTEAALATRQSAPAQSKRYLERAQTVMARYVVGGWDATGKPGGTRWGSDPAKPNTSDRGTSATAGSALAALMLARAGVKTQFYGDWGLQLLSWIFTRLRDADGLIMDALIEPNWEARRVKWTYNTGVPMRAYVEHFRLTKNPRSLEMATQLARAALDVNGALFDSAVHDAAKRHLWDGTYFVHYLLDGLLHVAQSSSDARLVKAASAQAQRSANYAFGYLRDPADNFYWRNWRLYAIGAQQHETWQKWTGQTIAPAYDASERSQEPRFASRAVAERPLVKTLLANAGAARMFWLAARFPRASPTLLPIARQ